MDPIIKATIAAGVPYAVNIIRDILEKVPNIAGKGRAAKKRRNDLEDRLNKYLSNLYGTCSYLQTIAFASNPKPLEDLYIPTSLVHVSGEELLIDKLTNIFEKSSTVAVFDSAGMGKSTIVKRLVLNEIVSANSLPVLFELRSFRENDKLEEELLKLLKIQGLLPDEGLIFVDYPVSIYLDGLDEAPADLAAEITRQLLAFHEKYPRVRILVSSRRQTEISVLLSFYCYGVKNLTDQQAFELIERYDEGGDLSKSLIKAIKESSFPKIRAYLSNPLYVSLLFCAYRHKPSLPQKMSIFYERVYAALFDQHDLTKSADYTHSLKTGLDSREFMLVLRKLAFKCVLDGYRVEYSKIDFEEKVSSVVKSIEYHKIKVSDFLRDSTVAVPLFIDDGHTVRWAHKSLMEYFAALFICYDTENKDGEFMLKLVQDSNAYKYKHILEMCADVKYPSFRKTVAKYVLGDYVRHCDSKYQTISNRRIKKPDVLSRVQATYGIKAFLMLSNELSVSKISSGGLSIKLPWKNGTVANEVAPQGNCSKTEQQNIGVEGLVGMLSKICDPDCNNKNWFPAMNLQVDDEVGLLCFKKESVNRWLLRVIAEKESSEESSIIEITPDVALGNLSISKGTFYKITDDPKEKYNNSTNFKLVTGVLGDGLCVTIAEAKSILESIEADTSSTDLAAMLEAIG
ncbi:NACHT domain-containing protein [Persicirhabdus sediminis]|uniref:NACHT domain-containing protein n=1 Tax=Persicirhabdus sediminis TaxID=454144 RepID=A0A8J7SIN9_9BACT|nr:hypothetical protein [Persicirhabdus sediminis]MBK1789685.1 hypothetical protein [Persicirhabdus sediminis]